MAALKNALKKRLLGGFLKTYVHEGEELATQISFTALMAGGVQLQNVHFVAERLQDLLASAMPLCLEVESCVANEIDASLDWRHLSSKPVILKIREMTINFIVHDAGSAQYEHVSEQKKRFWKMQADRMLGDQAAFAEMCAAGALPPTLTDRVARGLNIEIAKVTCRLSRPDAMVPEAFCELHSLRYGAVSDTFEWTNHLEETRASVESLKEVQYFLRLDVQRIRLYPISSESDISVGPLSLKDVIKVPASLPLVAPFNCTSHIELDLGSFRIYGPEEKLLIVLKLVNDISQSMQLTRKLDELSQLDAGEDSPLLRFYTGSEFAGSFRVESELAESHCDFDDAEEEEEEMGNVVRAIMEKQENWWNSIEGRKLSELSSRRAAIDSMLERRRKASEQVEAFFQIGVRSSLDEADARMQAVSHDISIRGRSFVASDSLAALRIPNEAVVRIGVKVKQLLVDVNLPEGRLAVDVEDVNFISDSSVPLTSEARSCCAKLFDLPLGTNDEEASTGPMLSNLTIRALCISFLAGECSQADTHRVIPSACNKEVKGDDENSGDERIVVLLPKGRSPSLTLRARGVGYPLCCAGMKLEPMDLIVIGLNIHAGRGLEALIAFCERLRMALPQVSVASPRDVPASCYYLRFVDTSIVQQPPPESVLCHGNWPMKVSVPLVEANTVSCLFDLPSLLHGTLYPNWKIDGREWWQPVLYSDSEAASPVPARNEAQVQAHLLRLEREVDFLRQSQLESASREDKLKDELRRLRQHMQSVKGNAENIFKISAIGIAGSGLCLCIGLVAMFALAAKPKRMEVR